MRIYQLLHAVVEKFVPLDITTKTELQTGAVNAYNAKTQELNSIKQHNKEALEYNTANQEKEDFVPREFKKVPPQLKAFELLESWWMRYLIAISFIFLVPKIKAIMSGESSKEDDGQDGEDGEFDDFIAFQRYKRNAIL